MPVPSTTYNLTRQDKQEIINSAQRLGVEPAELSAVMLQESGIRPNQWELKGGDHFGVIQFGGPEREMVGMDPKRVAAGDYTVAEQMPYVEKFLTMRGYKPGMGIKKLYTTILAGNPGANPDAEDSNTTSVNKVYKSFQKGGALYNNAVQMLGDVPQTAPYNPPEYQQAKVEQQRYRNDMVRKRAFEQLDKYTDLFTPKTNNDGRDLKLELDYAKIKQKYAQLEADLAIDEAKRMIKQGDMRKSTQDVLDEPLLPKYDPVFNVREDTDETEQFSASRPKIKNLANQATQARRARQQALRSATDDGFASKAFYILGQG